jgi:outer membrane protein assembly factor BamE (lipoprotein component of BamABCDE complex)
MNKPIALAAALLAVASLEACATTATRLDPALAARVAGGAHDRARVAELLGVPEDTQHFRVARGACTDAWHWNNATRTTFENLTVYFDANGVVCGHAYSGPRPRRVAPRPAAHLASR